MRSPRPCRAGTASLLAALGFVASLNAQPLPGPERPRGPQAPIAGSHIEALVHMRQAEASLRRGDVNDAVSLYEQAATEGAPPTVFREMAAALESAARWREAARAWTRYGSATQSPEEREDAFARSEELRQRLTALSVRVSPPLAARRARVWFDHEPPRFYQAGGVQRVIEGGVHRVRVEAPGYTPFETMVTTGYGEPREVVVVLTAGASPPPSPGMMVPMLPRTPAQ